MPKNVLQIAPQPVAARTRRRVPLSGNISGDRARALHAARIPRRRGHHLVCRAALLLGFTRRTHPALSMPCCSARLALSRTMSGRSTGQTRASQWTLARGLTEVSPSWCARLKNGCGLAKKQDIFINYGNCEGVHLEGEESQDGPSRKKFKAPCARRIPCTWNCAFCDRVGSTGCVGRDCCSVLPCRAHWTSCFAKGGASFADGRRGERRWDGACRGQHLCL